MRNVSELSATDREIFTKFVKWLFSSWFSMPITDNTILLIANRYTPGEAEFLTDLPLTPKTIEDLAGFKNTGMDELRKKWMTWPNEAWYTLSRRTTSAFTF